MTSKKGLMERLNKGVVVGDGGFTWQLEKRGYVKAGAYTPEVVIERPDAVLNLHREFLDSGSDVMQAFTFYASDDRLRYGGNTALESYSGEAINRAACTLAKKAAGVGDCLVAAGLSQIAMFEEGSERSAVKKEFEKQVKVFIECGVDFLIVEFFKYIEEIEIAIEVAASTGLPVVATMCIGPDGEATGISTEECAVRMAVAGASVVGVNCMFDPRSSLDTIRLMKKATEASGIEVHFASQPLGFLVPETPRSGYWSLPDFPFAMEPRTCTRFDFHRYAREAYDLGVRYIGGCCGTEAYHIRAIVEELEVERGIHREKPFSCLKHEPWGGGLKMSQLEYIKTKANRKYWETHQPATGRPLSASMSTPCDVIHNKK